MNNLREAFETLTRSGVKYAVIQDHHSLPHNPSPPIHILTADLDLLVQLLGVSKIKDSLYILAVQGGSSIDFIIRPKGKNLFPERFESSLLNTAVIHDDCFKKSDYHHDFWGHLYRWLHHDNRFPHLPDAILIAQEVDRVVGEGVQPKFNDINFKRLGKM